MNLHLLKSNNFKFLSKKDLVQIKGGKGECHLSWDRDCGESDYDNYCHNNPHAPGCRCHLYPHEEGCEYN